MPISVQVIGSGAYTSPPGIPGALPPSPTYIAKILYDGVNITPVVLYADAQFTTSVNGTPGACSFRVRDDSHQFTFQVGRRIELQINGLAEWTGYVSRVRRSTAFPDGPASQTRFLIIEGVDINVLFRKRFVLKKSDPKDVSGVTYKAGTPTKDTTAIAELVTNYLDLRGDDLDTSSLVTNVDDINVDQDANPFAGSWTWEQAMAAINSLPAAVWYLNPDRKLVWADVDTATAPFGLSDAPDNSTTYGYREMEITYDGGSLVNDYLVWGAGQGSPQAVFKRLQSPSSQTTHGRWQASAVKTEVYKQATLDRVASSFVNGSPSSKRGHKDDKVAVSVTTYRQGLRAGMGVSFSCAAFGFSDVLPVRQLRITFPSPTQPRYDLLLSHEIDTPWNFTDVYHPKWTLPKWPNVGWYWATDGVACAADDFSRTVSGSWGTGAIGTWTGTDSLFSVNGAAGTYTRTSNSGVGNVSVPIPSSFLAGSFTVNALIKVAPATSLDMSTYYTFSSDARASGFTVILGLINAANSSNGAISLRGNYVTNPDDTSAFPAAPTPLWKTTLELNGASFSYVAPYYANGSSSSGSSSVWPASDQYFNLKLYWDGATLKGKTWLAGTTQPDWQIAGTGSIPSLAKVYLAFSANEVYAGNNISVTYTVDQLDVCPDNATASTITDTIPGEITASMTGNGAITIPLGPYFRGTTRIFKNGIIQRQGIDYTESPAAGEILFATPTSTSDKIVAHFVAATPTNGGVSRRMF